MSKPALLALSLALISSSAFADSRHRDSHSERVDSGEVVCETIHERVPIRRGVYVLEHYTRCFQPASETRMETACGVLLETYGVVEGERRCNELLARASRDEG